MKNTLELNFNKNFVELSVTSELKNSLFFSIFASHSTENIKAEIKRIEADIELLKYLVNVDFLEIVTISKISENEIELIEQIKSRFNISHEQAEIISNLNLTFFNNNLEQMINRLERFVVFLKSIEENG